MPVQIVITWNDEKLRGALKAALRRGQDLTEPFEVAGEQMLSSIAENFNVGGRPARWPISKRVQKSGGQTLVDSARLKSSITYKASSNKVVIGTNVIYGRIHQLGGTIEKTVQVVDHWRYQDKAFGKPINPRSTFVKAHPMKMNLRMPARPFLVVQEEDKKYIGRVLADYIMQPLKEGS